MKKVLLKPFSTVNFCDIFLVSVSLGVTLENLLVNQKSEVVIVVSAAVDNHIFFIFIAVIIRTDKNKIVLNTNVLLCLDTVRWVAGGPVKKSVP